MMFWVVLVAILYAVAMGAVMFFLNAKNPRL